MKRLFSIILLVATVQAMEKNPEVFAAKEEEKRQTELIYALDLGEKPQIDKLVNANTINKPFGLFGYKGHTPLTLTLVGQFGFYRHAPQFNREETARYLISKGADSAPLNPYLEIAAIHGDLDKVKLLLSFGAKDSNDKALKKATDTYNYYAAEQAAYCLYDTDAPARYSEIVKLLQQAKRGPVKLKPMAKPAAAKPAASQQPYVSDAARLIGLALGGEETAVETKPSTSEQIPAKPAVQPVRLVPKTAPKPVAKSTIPQP